jgi:hypothetical protein
MMGVLFLIGRRLEAPDVRTLLSLLFLVSVELNAFRDGVPGDFQAVGRVNFTWEAELRDGTGHSPHVVWLRV